MSGRRTTFLVDGFNLYHSLVQASDDLGGAQTKWLDLKSLLASTLHNVGGGAQLQEIVYFSALAAHRAALRPGTLARHRQYLACLAASGILPVMGRFKSRETRCRACGRITVCYEEKETDVAIAVRLLETFVLDRADVVMIVSGDTDLAPAIRSVQRLYPSREVGVIFPYRRVSTELRKAVTLSIHLGKEQYRRHQLPDPFLHPLGRSIWKPAEW